MFRRITTLALAAVALTGILIVASPVAARPLFLVCVVPAGEAQPGTHYVPIHWEVEDEGGGGMNRAITECMYGLHGKPRGVSDTN